MLMRITTWVFQLVLFLVNVSNNCEVDLGTFYIHFQ